MSRTGEREQVRLQRIIQHIKPTATFNHNGTINQSICSAADSSSQSSESSSSSSSSTTSAVLTTTPSQHLANRHWNGWGYRDTQFTLTSTGNVALAGHRYAYSGKVMPHLRSWMETMTGIDVKDATPSQVDPTSHIKPPTLNTAFLSRMAIANLLLVIESGERLFHSHGHTAQEVYTLRFGAFNRVPDAVVYPQSHSQVEFIVKAAYECDVVIIPFGGGTSVTQALICPSNETRMILSLDLKKMNNIKWINRNNLTACIEAGAVGKEIESQLATQNFTLGHEPDSMEFSTLGGWIATRASGMRKNKYGNIEDIVIHIKLVTGEGNLLEKSYTVPRMSCGPDIHEFILGSEGIYGVITEAIVHICPKPEFTLYGSILFPSFESGVLALSEIQRENILPVSIRLVDNNQFQFGQALKVATEDKLTDITDKMKKWYVTKHLKYEVNKMVAATLLFEGSKKNVALQEKQVYGIAAKYGGMKAGSENGIRGYFLTYMIAYLRDFGFNYSFIGESFETSCPYENILQLCEQTKQSIILNARKLKVKKTPFVSCRVTQLYNTGVCVYFYFGFVWTGLADPVGVFNVIEHEARNCIIANGGSISHHHGIGKLRKEWMEKSVSKEGIKAITSLKKSFDPKNIFASGNLIDL